MLVSAAWLVCGSAVASGDWSGRTLNASLTTRSAVACSRCRWRHQNLVNARRQAGLRGALNLFAWRSASRLRATLDSADANADAWDDDDAAAAAAAAEDGKHEDGGAEESTDTGERTFHDIPETWLPLEELQKRIRKVKQSDEDADKDADRTRDIVASDQGERRSVFEVEATIVEGEEAFYDPGKEVYVLVFRSAPRGAGIYSLRLGDEDIILAFERDVEATHYAHLLAAQEFPEAEVEKLRIAQVYEFCEQTGLRMGLVPSGMMIVPPQDNMPGYERYFRDAPENGPPDREYAGEFSERQLNELKRRLGRLVDEGPDKAGDA
ncbi:hypothetical protein CCYA_CCYA01G0021 [Cyanidiococcus yangmingshanensis]|nr:hypothetical protein CCYA_CCYA01G0021 [Cyanidiococcus yangmingshanensis]